MLNQALQVLQPRNPFRTFSIDEFPHQNHQPAVRDCEIGFSKRPAIQLVFVSQLHHRWRRRHNEHATGLEKRIDCVSGRSDEKTNAQYLLRRRDLSSWILLRAEIHLPRINAQAETAVLSRHQRSHLVVDPAIGFLQTVT